MSADSNTFHALRLAAFWERGYSRVLVRWGCASGLAFFLMIAFTLQYGFPEKPYGIVTYFVSVCGFYVVEGIWLRRIRKKAEAA